VEKFCNPLREWRIKQNPKKKQLYILNEAAAFYFGRRDAQECLHFPGGALGSIRQSNFVSSKAWAT